MQMITSRLLYVLLWCVYIIAVVIGTEVFAYLWHRFGAHADYIPGIHDTHRIHHILYFNEADEDFVWILMLMMIFEIIVGIGVMIGLIPGILAIVTIIVSLIVFWWNWWIHRAYHQPDHWLNSYAWFQHEKDRHFIHHENSSLNYGIASHFNDWILGTWIEPSFTNNNEPSFTNNNEPSFTNNNEYSL